MSLITTPAESLLGLTLQNDWYVFEKVIKPKGHTGGNFSCGYKVKRDSEIGFLKALDYTKAMDPNQPNPSVILEEMTKSYNFECDMLKKCINRKMDKVVKALEFGKINLDNEPSKLVEYIIFEYADRGDIRNRLINFSHNFDTAWLLRAMHNIVTGMHQLHTENIAHQDMKPSNALVFGDKYTKVTDLGRSYHPKYNPPHSILQIAGDSSYASPELLYNYLDSDITKCKLSCDIYQTGSMIIFLFSGNTMNSIMFNNLDPQFLPKNWNGTYQDVLPYLREAFNDAITEFLNPIQPDELKIKLEEILRRLCDPDINNRGDLSAKSIVKSQYSLYKFITKFDVLARKAEYNLFGIR